MEQSFIEGMHSFAKHIPDFDRKDAIISGVESRTSSPVRIRRMRCLRQISEAFIHAEREPDMQEESLLRQWTA